MNIQDNKHSTFSTSMGDALASALGQRAPGAPDLSGEDIVNPGAPDLEPELGLIDDTLPNILPDDLTLALDEDLGSAGFEDIHQIAGFPLAKKGLPGRNRDFCRVVGKDFDGNHGTESPG